MAKCKNLWGAVATALLIGSGLCTPLAQAAFTVTLEQVGTSVVATGSGAIDLADLTYSFTTDPNIGLNPGYGALNLGSGTSLDLFHTITGPADFGTTNAGILANSESGDFVSIQPYTQNVGVPTGYQSGDSLSDSATWDNQTFATLGVTPGTYVWTWGSGADADGFTLQVGGCPCPSPTRSPCSVWLRCLGICWQQIADVDARQQ